MTPKVTAFANFAIPAQGGRLVTTARKLLAIACRAFSFAPALGNAAALRLAEHRGLISSHRTSSMLQLALSYTNALTRQYNIANTS